MHHVTCQPWKIWLPKNAHFFTPPPRTHLAPQQRHPNSLASHPRCQSVLSELEHYEKLQQQHLEEVITEFKKWRRRRPTTHHPGKQIVGPPSKEPNKNPRFGWEITGFFQGNLGLGEMFCYEFGRDHSRWWVPNFFYLQKITWGNDSNWVKNHQGRLSFDGFRFLWVCGIWFWKRRGHTWAFSSAI